MKLSCILLNNHFFTFDKSSKMGKHMAYLLNDKFSKMHKSFSDRIVIIVANRHPF